MSAITDQSAPGAGRGWGDWRLGDLSGALARACGVIGGSCEVASVSVFAPYPGEPRPRVYVLVGSLAEAEEMVAWVIDGGAVTEVDESPSYGTWRLEVDGLLLRIVFDYMREEP